MYRRRLITSLPALAGLAWRPEGLRAQSMDYPARPLRIVVPFNAGSGSDTGSRVYGEILSKMVGQPVVIENRPGASGQLAIQAVKQAPADGYTILLASNSPLTVNPVVTRQLPYDPVKDIKPVVGLGRGPVALVVRGDAPQRTVRELLDTALREKRPLTAGNYSAGYQLINAWLGTVGGVEINQVGYKGGTQMVTDLIAGQLDFVSIDLGGILHLLKDRRVRVLAITDERRHPMLPEVPTLRESGYPEFVSWVWTALYVRSETPDELVARLSDLMLQVLASEKARAYHATLTSEVMALRPDEMRRFQLAETERFRRAAEAAGIRPQ